MSKEQQKQNHNKILSQGKERGFKYLREGILYNLIKMILREEDSAIPQDTLKTCEYFSITNSSSIEDDYKTIDSFILQNVEDFYPPLVDFHAGELRSKAEFIYGLKQYFNQSSEIGEKEMEWLVFGAISLTGIYLAQRLISKEKEELQVDREQSVGLLDIENIPISTTPVIAILCMIVPARIASNFKREKTLVHSDIEYLLDNSSYFLCVDINDVIRYEQNLKELTNEEIAPDSQKEVYIRVNITNGGNLIGKKSCFGLKNNLSVAGNFCIKKVFLLEDLSGLEQFNRV
jgi:hypothetical protein